MGPEGAAAFGFQGCRRGGEPGQTVQLTAERGRKTQPYFYYYFLSLLIRELLTIFWFLFRDLEESTAFLTSFLPATLKPSTAVSVHYLFVPVLIFVLLCWKVALVANLGPPSCLVSKETRKPTS